MATVRITYGMAAVRLHFSTKWTNNKPFESRFFCLARCRLLTRSLHHLSFHLFAVFSFTLLPLFLRAKTPFNPICCKSIARFLQVWAVLLCNGRAAFALRSIIGPALIYPYHSVQFGIAQFPLRSSLCRHSLNFRYSSYGAEVPSDVPKLRQQQQIVMNCASCKQQQTISANEDELTGDAMVLLEFAIFSIERIERFAVPQRM